MSEYTQAENDELVAAVKKASGTSASLYMNSSNFDHFRGLQIHRGGANYHYVDASIRDVKVLAEIVKAFDAAWGMGYGRGVADNQSTIREALGIQVNDSDDTFYKA